MRHALPGTSRWRIVPVIAALIGLLVGGAGVVVAASANAATGCQATQTCTGSIGPSQSLPVTRQAASRVQRDAMEAVAAMQPGWDPGNSLDAIPDETSWGNPPITEDLLDAVRAQGFNSVRLSVTWTDHQQSAAPYTIDPEWMSGSGRSSTGRSRTGST